MQSLPKGDLTRAQMNDLVTAAPHFPPHSTYSVPTLGPSPAPASAPVSPPSPSTYSNPTLGPFPAPASALASHTTTTPVPVQVNEMVEAVDDGDGEIDYDEFVTMIQKY